jgi:hypothetical protein
MVPLYVELGAASLVCCCEDLLFQVKPALRAAACGGRPRAGSDATVTGEPTAPG